MTMPVTPERCGDRSSGLTDLCIDHQPAFFGLGKRSNVVEFDDQFLVKFVAAGRVNDDEIGRSSGLETVSNDGCSILCFWFTVDLDRSALEKLAQLSVGTGTVHVSLNHRHANAVLLPVPLRQFGGRGGLSLTVQTHQEKRGTVRPEFSRRSEEPNEFGVEDVHCVRLQRDAWAGFFFPHPRLKTFDDFLGLPDVEICLLQGSTKALRHVTELFFIQPTLRLEEAKGPENAL